MINIAAEETTGNPGDFAQWVQATASGICKGLYHRLGPGMIGWGDHNDECGWLCCSTAVRLVHENDKDCWQLRAAMAIRALELILDKPFVIDVCSNFFAERAQQTLASAKESTAFKAILLSCICLQTLELNEQADFSRCFAICDCSKVAFKRDCFAALMMTMQLFV